MWLLTWNRAASQSDKGKKSACPLIAESMVHLDREEDSCGAPDAAKKRLGCQRRSCLMLIGVDLSQPVSIRFVFWNCLLTWMCSPSSCLQSCTGR